MNNIIYVLIFILSVFIASISQILLKLSANEKHNSQINEYLNFKVILAYCLFIVSLLLTTYAYKKIPLSFGPIIESLGIIFIVLLGKLVLKENLSNKKLIGVGLILVGVVLTTL